jgi:hypothetical protein
VCTQLLQCFVQFSPGRTHFGTNTIYGGGGRISQDLLSRGAISRTRLKMTVGRRYKPRLIHGARRSCPEASLDKLSRSSTMYSHTATVLGVAALCFQASAFAPAPVLPGSIRRGALPLTVSAINCKSKLAARPTVAEPAGEFCRGYILGNCRCPSAAQGCARALAAPKSVTLGDAPKSIFWAQMLAEPDPAEIILRSLKKLLR